jgi:hypothetical protein
MLLSKGKKDMATNFTRATPWLTRAFAADCHHPAYILLHGFRFGASFRK